MSKSRRRFLQGFAVSPLAALSARAGAEEPKCGTKVESTWGKLTLVITGLCAFVPEGTERLTILLLDAHEDENQHDPRHSAAVALLRFDKSGGLFAYPTVKALEGEALSIEAYDPTAGKIVLDDRYLVNMTGATGANSDNPYDVIHPDTLAGNRKVLARLVLEAATLGGTLTTEFPHCPVTYVFPNKYTVKVVDEIRLTMPLPANGACLRVNPLKKNQMQPRWSTPIALAGDGAAVLVLSNIPIHEPFSSGIGMKDHHFTRYYPMARKSGKKVVPETGEGYGPLCPPDKVTGKGGAVPRCAMALFKPK